MGVLPDPISDHDIAMVCEMFPDASLNAVKAVLCDVGSVERAVEALISHHKLTSSQFSLCSLPESGNPTCQPKVKE
jgi:hypothetical protein